MPGIPSNVANLAFALQSAKGSPAAASTHRLWLTDGTLPHSSRVKEDFVETTGARMLSDSYTSTVRAAGAPAFFVMPSSIAALLYAILGTKSVTGASDPYIHTIVGPTSAVASLPRYLTFWASLGNGLFEKFTDCKVTHLKIHGEWGKPLTCTATIMGLSPSYLAAEEATVAIEKTHRFMHADGVGALQVEGAPISSISSFDIDIDSGAAEIGGDALTPNDISDGQLTIVTATTQLVTDFALWKRMHYGTATPIAADPPTATVLEIATGIDFMFNRAVGRLLRLTIPRVQPRPFNDQPSTSAEPLKREVTYDAYAPTAGTTPIAVEVRNADATIT